MYTSYQQGWAGYQPKADDSCRVMGITSQDLFTNTFNMSWFYILQVNLVRNIPVSIENNSRLNAYLSNYLKYPRNIFTRSTFLSNKLLKI